jgi:hypothetical protein
MGSFAVHWLQSWLISWLLMLPVVLIAAPFIRKLTDMAAAGPRLRLDAALLNSHHFRRKTRYWRLRFGVRRLREGSVGFKPRRRGGPYGAAKVGGRDIFMLGLAFSKT